MIAAGFFSLTGGAEGGDDAAYLRWHLLDHQPEQHTIAGLRASTRWVADEECVAARIAASPELEPVRHAVQYLFAEPVEPSLEEFVALAARLRADGRMLFRAQSCLLGAFEAVDVVVGSAVSPAALPHRAHRGVVLVIGSQPVDLASLLVDGVAGAYTYAAGDRLGRGQDQGERFGLAVWDPKDRRITVVYVDGDLLEVTDRLRPVLEPRRPDLALPMRSTVRHAAWPEG